MLADGSDGPCVDLPVGTPTRLRVFSSRPLGSCLGEEAAGWAPWPSVLLWQHRGGESSGTSLLPGARLMGGTSASELQLSQPRGKGRCPGVLREASMSLATTWPQEGTADVHLPRRGGRRGKVDGLLRLRRSSCLWRRSFSREVSRWCVLVRRTAVSVIDSLHRRILEATSLAQSVAVACHSESSAMWLCVHALSWGLLTHSDVVSPCIQ